MLRRLSRSSSPPHPHLTRVRQLEGPLHDQRAAVAGVELELSAVNDEVLAGPLSGAPLSLRKGVLHGTGGASEKSTTQPTAVSKSAIGRLAWVLLCGVCALWRLFRVRRRSRIATSEKRKCQNRFSRQQDTCSVDDCATLRSNRLLEEDTAAVCLFSSKRTRLLFLLPRVRALKKQRSTGRNWGTSTGLLRIVCSFFTSSSRDVRN